MNPSDESQAREAAARLALGDGAPDLGAILRALDRHLAFRFSGTSPDLRAEARDEAIVRFLSALNERGEFVAADSALAYIRSIASNALIDMLRRERVAQRRLPAAAYIPAGDDAISRFIDATATSDVIEALLTELAENGDRVATRVINAFLALAERDEREPTSREVAAESDVSHTAVAKVLSRLRTSLSIRFPEVGPRS